MKRDLKALGVTSVAMAWIMALSGTAFAGHPTNTNWLGAGSEEPGIIGGAVGVCRQDQQECEPVDGTMKVKLFKRVDGAWKRIATKQAEKESGNLWSVRFTGAPKRGKCKLLGIYSGSETYDPSRDSVRGACTDTSWTT